jgi:CheY-like chemotaxis protein
MADDDEDDRLIVREALDEAKLANDVRFVVDGEDLMDYLRHDGAYTDAGCAPRPDLILLDLNMPRKDGREALREIRSDVGLRQIPVVILTTSQEERDVKKMYDLGANSFIVKPVSFEGLVDTMKSLSTYWVHTVTLP